MALWLFFCSIILGANDLDETLHPGVLTSQQVYLPQYPHAFNPSVARWQDKLVLSFRYIPDPKKSFTSYIGMVWLDEHFKPSSTPQLLRLRKSGSKVPSRAEDGRLLVINNVLYLLYSDNTEPQISRRGFRMYIAEIGYENETFVVRSVEPITSFMGDTENKREKNWVPFDYHNQLLLGYSINPHRIMQPCIGTGHCDVFVESEREIEWCWGQLRGGTQAVLDGDHYIAFFHSSINLATIQSRGKEVMHYFVGAYTFSAYPPFELQAISPRPIIGKKWYKGKEYKPYWKPVQVVFPCGILIEHDYIYLSYGRQDHEMWIATIDKRQLYESLIKISD